VLGTSTRFSKGMIKSRTEASRVGRGGRKSSVRGALYESTSIAAPVYGTICSLVWESWGSPELWYASTRKPRGKWNSPAVNPFRI
jgi:hypothetical protein